jgi:hypothetical protein
MEISKSTGKKILALHENELLGNLKLRDVVNRDFRTNAVR